MIRSLRPFVFLLVIACLLPVALGADTPPPATADQAGAYLWAMLWDYVAPGLAGGGVAYAAVKLLLRAMVREIGLASSAAIHEAIEKCPPIRVQVVAGSHTFGDEPITGVRRIPTAAGDGPAPAPVAASG